MSRRALLAAALLSCAPLDPIELARCGNGVLEAGERCDPLAPAAFCGGPGDGAAACQLLCAPGGASCPEGTGCGAGGFCVERDVCGNGVVERLEDCDDRADAGCGAPGARGACRFVCSAERSCPPGAVCAEGLCEAPLGLSLEPASIALRGGGLRVADFDADGRADLAKIDGSRLVARFSRGDGTFSEPVERVLDAPTNLFELGDVDGDGVQDVVAPGLYGVSVLLGGAVSPLRALVPATLDFPGQGRVFGVALRTSSTATAQCLITHAPGLWAFLLGGGGSATQPEDLLVVPSSSDALAGEPLVGELDGDGGAEEVVLSLFGEPMVRVLEVAAVRLVEGRPVYALRERQRVATEAYVTGRRPLLADVDGDGDLDLVVFTIGLRSPERAEVYGGDGRGGFGARLREVETWIEELSAGYCPTRCFPLWLGDLDADGRADAALPSSVIASSRPGGLPIAFATAEAWAEIVVADFNGDGRLDVAGNTRTFGVDFFLGTGVPGVVNPANVHSDVFIESVAVGDFNGDERADLVLRGIGEGDPAGVLAVMYGEVEGPPSEPVESARFPEIYSVIPHHLPPAGLVPPDRLTDVAVFWMKPGPEPVAQLSLIGGTLGRRLASPIVMADLSISSTQVDVPLGVAVGDFTGDGVADALVRVTQTFGSSIAYAIEGARGGLGGTSVRRHELASLVEACGLRLGDEQCSLNLSGALEPGAPETWVQLEAPCTIEGAADDTVRVVRWTPEGLRCTAAALGHGVNPLDAILRDLDGDGFAELVIGGQVRDGGPSDAASAVAAVVVARGGPGGFSSAETRVFRLSTDIGAVVAIAALNLDLDPALELVVARTKSQGALAVPVLSRIETLDVLAAPDARPVAAQVAELRSVRGLRVADIDGDGLDDVLAEEFSAVRVFRAVRAPPGARGQ